MQKLLALSVLGMVALSSCSIFGTRSAAVSGQLKGFSPNQNLGLAVVGYNNGQYVFDSNQAQVLDKFLTGGYTLALPRGVPAGTYRVIVFRDSNSNGQFNAGEQVISRDNGKLLVYASRDNQFFGGTKYGWNIYNGTADIQTEILNNYDLEAVAAQ